MRSSIPPPMNAPFRDPAATAASAAARPREGFLPHVHRFRGLAILLVVAAHCWPCFAWTPAQEHALLVLLDNVTVLFMFVSGLLFQHLIPRFRYPAYLRRRFATVMLPYVLISIPAIAMVIAVRHRDDVALWVYGLPRWEQALYFLATGKHLAPLWFMPMMALFILAAPLFVLIDRRRAYAWLLPPLVAVATWAGRDSLDGLLNVFAKALYMAPAYLAGMAYSRYRDRFEPWVARHWRALLALPLAVSGVIALRWVPLDLGLVQKLAAAPLLLLAMTRIADRGRLDRLLTRLAAFSFGLYFVHGYVITALRIGSARLEGSRAASGTVFAPSVPALLAMIVFVTLASMLAVGVVKRVAGRRSRMVIGA